MDKYNDKILGITIQPSEFVKILFVFFIASMLSKSRDFKQVIITTGFAGVHMGVLVLTPNSSAIAEKIKSLSLTGITSGEPFVNPVPK